MNEDIIEDAESLGYVLAKACCYSFDYTVALVNGVTFRFSYASYALTNNGVVLHLQDVTEMNGLECNHFPRGVDIWLQHVAYAFDHGS